MPGRQEGHVNRDQKWNHAAKITRGHSDAQKAGKPSRRPSLGPSGTHEPPAHATKEGLQQLQRDHFSNPTSWRQLDSSHLRNELDRAVKDLDIYMRIFSCNLTWINIHKSFKKSVFSCKAHIHVGQTVPNWPAGMHTCPLRAGVSVSRSTFDLIIIRIEPKSLQRVIKSVSRQVIRPV